MRMAFDIGCNIGKYTAKLIEAGYDRIIAVDPNTALFAQQFPDCVTRLAVACSSKEQDIPFYFSNCHTISTAQMSWVTDSRFSKDYQWTPATVHAVTIDQIVAHFGVPEHIKVDVEGYELEALKGMTQKYAKEVCFEWAEEEGPQSVACVEHLHSLGYTLFGSLIGDDYLVEPTKYLLKDEFLKEFVYDTNRKTEWGMIWAK